MIEFENYPDSLGFPTEVCNNWLVAVAESNDRRVGQLVYHFVDDARILEINKTFLDHDYYTDIITFNYNKARRISGEVYISIDTVASNTAKLETSPGEEMARVVVHGLLHLIGFDDKNEEESRQMREEEDKCLILLAKFLKEN